MNENLLMEIAKLREENRALSGIRKVGQRVFQVQDKDGKPLYNSLVRRSLAVVLCTEPGDTMVPAGIEWRS